ncbi:MAG TPA: 50S ribosomal protein L24 [Candidatus Bathyarchaeota archaeon]|nr:50S ribosomal protein L24 [Candidatus Bathyarchaeota archaeon]
MKTTKPTEQRKRLYQAPVTERYRRFSAPLSSKLQESHGTTSVPVRKGDTVLIMRGDRKGFEGKVTQINRKNYRIFVEGADREKVDGTKISVPIHPSKIMITRLNLDDKWRKKILERKGVAEKAEIAEEAPPKKEKKKKSKTSKITKKSGGT